MLSATTRAIERIRRGQRGGNDDGFSLLEAVVSMSILLIVSVSILSLLIGTMKVQQVTRLRADATAYAQRELERISSWAYSDYMRIMTDYDGKYIAEPFKVGTHTLYETINVDWATNPANPTSGSPDYFRVTIEITWDNMGSMRPVTATTYIAPPGDIFNKYSGHVEVAVVDHTGAPLVGAAVELVQLTTSESSTLNTDITGTAFFAYRVAGWYEATATLAGYIGPERKPTSMAANIWVEVGVKTPVVIVMGQPASVEVSLYDPSSNPVSSPDMAGIAVSYQSQNPMFQGGTNPVVMTNLFPGRYDIDGTGFHCVGSSMVGMTGSLPDQLVEPGHNVFSLDVTGGPPSTVNLTVEVLRGTDLAPVQGAQINLISNCGQSVSMPTTNSQGKSTRTNMYRGPYIMTVTPPVPYLPKVVYPIVRDGSQVTVVVS